MGELASTCEVVSEEVAIPDKVKAQKKREYEPPTASPGDEDRIAKVAASAAVRAAMEVATSMASGGTQSSSSSSSMALPSSAQLTGRSPIVIDQHMHQATAAKAVIMQAAAALMKARSLSLAAANAFDEQARELNNIMEQL